MKAPDVKSEDGKPSDFNAAERIESLQATMQQDVGPFRTEAGLKRALDHIRTLRHELAEFRPPPGVAIEGRARTIPARRGHRPR